MKHLLVGKGILRGAHAKLFLIQGSGGEATFYDDGLEINIGADQSWPNVISTLLHEIQEATYIMNDSRFLPADRFNNRASEYRFFMTHEEFGVACDNAGHFITPLLPSLAVCYKKWTASRKAHK
jgi:hypothetical protein